jgi:hypothetical protein
VYFCSISWNRVLRGDAGEEEEEGIRTADSRQLEWEEEAVVVGAAGAEGVAGPVCW